jgi:hypothetical protein
MPQRFHKNKRPVFAILPAGLYTLFRGLWRLAKDKPPGASGGVADAWYDTNDREGSLWHL